MTSASTTISSARLVLTDVALWEVVLALALLVVAIILMRTAASTMSYRTASGKHLVTLIPGNGSGPEVTNAAKRIIEAAGVLVEWEEREAAGHYDRFANHSNKERTN